MPQDDINKPLVPDEAPEAAPEVSAETEITIEVESTALVVAEVDADVADAAEADAFLRSRAKVAKGKGKNKPMPQAKLVNAGDDDDDAEGAAIATSLPRTTRCDDHSGDAPRGKLQAFNWLSDVPGGFADCQMVEVQFKNTRKGFYKNSTHLPLEIGDMVAVEASPGHDIGRVSMVGALVKLQMQKANIKPDTEFKRVFRKAKPADLEKFEEARARETETMIRARRIAEDLKLNMKIGDVEFQGDGNKAIFYYIADERVDFRQLIKVLAEAFRVRIEMKQIGARQEAGRIGGIGPCGRPLCCSSWMTNFVTVATSAARFQDISLNPQKLAGQCAKLKCCLNFEVDAYVETMKKMPGKDMVLETTDAKYFLFKTDVFKREVTYSTEKNSASNLVTISAERAFEVIALNKEGQKPESLSAQRQPTEKEKRIAHDILSDGDLTRFDKKKKNKKRPAQGQQPQPKGQKPRPEGGKARPEGKPRPEGAPQQNNKPRKPKPQGQKPKKPNNNGNNGNQNTEKQ